MLIVPNAHRPPRHIWNLDSIVLDDKVPDLIITPHPPRRLLIIRNSLYINNLHLQLTPSRSVTALQKSRLLQYCFFERFRTPPKEGSKENLARHQIAVRALLIPASHPLPASSMSWIARARHRQLKSPMPGRGCGIQRPSRGPRRFRSTGF
jgi:hypothetical protein